MDYKNILFEQEGNVAVIQINREKAMNALNTETLQELESVLDFLATESNIKVGIITGAGEKAFIAGADISEMAHKTSLEAKEFARLGLEVTKKMENLPQPLIAAVNGYAFGGGCEMALACDFRIASEKAAFAQPEVGLGITPGFGATQRLSRAIGIGKASEMLLTGKVVKSEEALRCGLVNEVVPGDQLMAKARELALAICQKGNIAIRFTKAAVQKGKDMDLEKALELEANYFALCFSTGEQKEGMQAFLEKRKAVFRGR